VVMLERDEETWHVDIEPIPAAAGKPPGARIKVRGIKALVDNQPWKVKKSMMSFSGKLNLRVTVTRLELDIDEQGLREVSAVEFSDPDITILESMASYVIQQIIAREKQQGKSLSPEGVSSKTSETLSKKMKEQIEKIPPDQWKRFTSKLQEALAVRGQTRPQGQQNGYDATVAYVNQASPQEITILEHLATFFRRCGLIAERHLCLHRMLALHTQQDSTYGSQGTFIYLQRVVADLRHYGAALEAQELLEGVQNAMGGRGTEEVSLWATIARAGAMRERFAVKSVVARLDSAQLLEMVPIIEEAVEELQGAIRRAEALGRDGLLAEAQYEYGMACFAQVHKATDCRASNAGQIESYERALELVTQAMSWQEAYQAKRGEDPAALESKRCLGVITASLGQTDRGLKIIQEAAAEAKVASPELLCQCLVDAADVLHTKRGASASASAYAAACEQIEELAESKLKDSLYERCDQGMQRTSRGLCGDERRSCPAFQGQPERNRGLRRSKTNKAAKQEPSSWFQRLCGFFPC